MMICVEINALLGKVCRLLIEMALTTWIWVQLLERAKKTSICSISDFYVKEWSWYFCWNHDFSICRWYRLALAKEPWLTKIVVDPAENERFEIWNSFSPTSKYHPRYTNRLREEGRTDRGWGNLGEAMSRLRENTTRGARGSSQLEVGKIALWAAGQQSATCSHAGAARISQKSGRPTHKDSRIGSQILNGTQAVGQDLQPVDSLTYRPKCTYTIKNAGRQDLCVSPKAREISGSVENESKRWPQNPCMRTRYRRKTRAFSFSDSESEANSMHVRKRVQTPALKKKFASRSFVHSESSTIWKWSVLMKEFPERREKRNLELQRSKQQCECLRIRKRNAVILLQVQVRANSKRFHCSAICASSL